MNPLNSANQYQSLEFPMQPGYDNGGYANTNLASIYNTPPQGAWQYPALHERTQQPTVEITQPISQTAPTSVEEPRSFTIRDLAGEYKRLGKLADANLMREEALKKAHNRYQEFENQYVKAGGKPVEMKHHNVKFLNVDVNMPMKEADEALSKNIKETDDDIKLVLGKQFKMKQLIEEQSYVNDSYNKLVHTHKHTHVHEGQKNYMRATHQAPKTHNNHHHRHANYTLPSRTYHCHHFAGYSKSNRDFSIPTVAGVIAYIVTGGNFLFAATVGLMSKIATLRAQ